MSLFSKKITWKYVLSTHSFASYFFSKVVEKQTKKEEGRNGCGKKICFVKSELKISGCINNHFPDLWNKKAEYFQIFPAPLYIYIFFFSRSKNFLWTLGNKCIISPLCFISNETYPSAFLNANHICYIRKTHSAVKIAWKTGQVLL